MTIPARVEEFTAACFRDSLAGDVSPVEVLDPQADTTTERLGTR